MNVANCYKFTDKISSWLANGIFEEINETVIIKTIEENHPNNKLELDGLLLIACWKSTEKVIKKLLELGANKDAKSLWGTTPVMFLAQRDCVELVDYFIKIEADLLVHCSTAYDVVWYGKDNKKTRDYFLKHVYENVKRQNELTKKNVSEDKLNKDLPENNAQLKEKIKELETKLGQIKTQVISF